jgi:hypothetical protein
METLSHLGQYLCEFSHISLFLMHKGCLSADQQSVLFLKGFVPQFQSSLLSHLALSDPEHYPEDPWPFNNVLFQAKYLLSSCKCSLTQSTATPTLACASAPLALSPSNEAPHDTPGPAQPNWSAQRQQNFCFFCGEAGHICVQCHQC